MQKLKEVFTKRRKSLADSKQKLLTAKKNQKIQKCKEEIEKEEIALEAKTQKNQRLQIILTQRPTNLRFAGNSFQAEHNAEMELIKLEDMKKMMMNFFNRKHKYLLQERGKMNFKENQKLREEITELDQIIAQQEDHKNSIIEFEA